MGGGKPAFLTWRLSGFAVSVTLESPSGQSELTQNIKLRVGDALVHFGSKL
jgi:hypothetical protein